MKFISKQGNSAIFDNNDDFYLIVSPLKGDYLHQIHQHRWPINSVLTVDQISYINGYFDENEELYGWNFCDLNIDDFKTPDDEYLLKQVGLIEVTISFLDDLLYQLEKTKQ